MLLDICVCVLAGASVTAWSSSLIAFFFQIAFFPDIEFGLNHILIHVLSFIFYYLDKNHPMMAIN